MENSIIDKAKELVSQMTNAEKASLCSGADYWHIKGVERLGLKDVCLTDGPHGLRLQASSNDFVALGNSVPSTCFPAACATACSFDPALLEQMGDAMGKECLANDVGVILGPGVNMKRSPLCGRNFEYFSEDPMLSGKCAAGLIRGIEKNNVGTCLKHFAANNQEALRLVSDSCVDERALREIYLAPFETAVKEGHPSTVMCSYNKINGTYASDNRRLMTDILRNEWGFDGAVITDWGAMNDRIAALNAGTELQMPGPCHGEEEQILQALENKSLDIETLNTAVERIVCILLRAQQNEKKPYDEKAHHELAGKIAEESAVLLKNDGALPFSKTSKVFVTGGFAKAPRYQGAGSSQIVPTKLTSPLDAFSNAEVNYEYEEGFGCEELHPDPQKVAQVVSKAKSCDVICVFAGLPASYESEGFDRTHLELPESQITLIEALIKTDIPVVVVLSCGSSVDVPFANTANAILLMNLSGQNSGTAAFNLLYGNANPCGKLAQTWPMQLADTGNTAFFGGRQVQYRESIYVGYRWYDKANLQVRWPFGYGLSYAQFEYSFLRVSVSNFDVERSNAITINFTVKNTGSTTGKEVAQIYVSPPQDGLFMPVRELRGFAKLSLEAGESKTVRLQLDKKAFSYYNANAACWHVQNGVYTISVGTSSRDLPLTSEINVTGDSSITVPDYKKTAPAYYEPKLNCFDGEDGKKAFEAIWGDKLPALAPEYPLTRNSPVRDLKTTYLGRIILRIARGQAKKMLSAGVGGATAETSQNVDKMIDTMIYDMPIRAIGPMASKKITPKKIDAFVDVLNGHVIQGMREILKK